MRNIFLSCRTAISAFLSLSIACVSSSLVAQEKLDTGRTAMTTKVVTTIASSGNGQWELDRVRAAEVDRFGNLWILEDTDQKIRVFSPTGKLVRTLGGIGDGPGEFRHFSWIQALGDTMWVFDGSGGRSVPFDIATGKLLKSNRPVAQVVLRNGYTATGALSYSGGNFDAASETKPVAVAYFHTKSATKDIRKLAGDVRTRPNVTARVYDPAKGPPPPRNANGAGTMHTSQTFDSFLLVSPAFASSALILVDRAGSAAAVNPFTQASATSSFRVLRVGTTGDTTFNKQYVTPTRRLTSGDVSLVVDSISQGAAIVSNKRMLANTAHIRESLYVPKTWPPVTDMHVGIDGSIWLLQPSPPSKFAKFWRIASDGKTLPSVTVASGVRILRVSTNRIWVIREDGDGLPTIEIHDIVPAK